MKSISCIIPTCNRGSVLEAIESAVTQTRPPDEILVINNGSAVVTLPVELVQRVRIYKIVAFAGPAQARNFGASVATGDYFAFLDDDDLWSVNYLSTATAAIERGARLVVGRLDERDTDGVRPYKNAAGSLTVPILLVRNPGVSGSNIVVERNLFYELRGFDVKLPPSEDKSFILEALLRDIPIDVTPEAQVLVNKNGGVSLTSNAATMADGIWQFTQKYGRYMSTDQLLANVEKAYQYRKRAVESAEGTSHVAMPTATDIAPDELAKRKRITELTTRMALMATLRNGEQL